MSRPGTIALRASLNFCARPRSDGVAFIILSMPRSIFKGYIYPEDILTGCRQAVDEDYRTSIHLLASGKKKLYYLLYPLICMAAISRYKRHCSHANACRNTKRMRYKNRLWAGSKHVMVIKILQLELIVPVDQLLQR